MTTHVTHVHVENCDRLLDRLTLADQMSPELWTALIADTCKRMSTTAATIGAARLQRLAADGAWIDAALALLDIELSGWTPRRIAFDGNEWHCALAQDQRLPEWLDHAVEASHHDMALAMAKAIVATVRECATRPARRRATVPQLRGEAPNYLCCENF
jgi:hypothetical protein